MKKIIATLAVIFSLTTSATYAYDVKDVNKTVLKSFDKEFSGAQNVNWETLNDELYKVTFNYDSKSVEAFFDEKGELIAIGSAIAEDHLPLLVSKAVNTGYQGFDKKEIIEFTMNGETQYLITLSRDDKSYTIKASSAGEIQLYKKMRN